MGAVAAMSHVSMSATAAVSEMLRHGIRRLALLQMLEQSGMDVTETAVAHDQYMIIRARLARQGLDDFFHRRIRLPAALQRVRDPLQVPVEVGGPDRKSTRLNSS